MREHPDPERKSGTRLRFYVALVVILALGGGFGALLGLASYRPPEPPRQVFAPRDARRAVLRIQEQVEGVRRQSRAGVKKPYQLRVSNNDVNSYLGTHPPITGNLPAGIESVRDVHFAFEGGQVIVTGRVTAWGREFYMTVTGHAVPDGAGSVRFEPGAMSLGRLPMPAPLRAHVTRRIEKEMQRRIGEMGVTVNSIDATAGSLVIEGQTGRGK